MSLARTPFGASSSQIVNIEYDGDDNPIYVGYAAPGTADADELWLIWRYTWTAGNCVAIRVANGSLEYGSAWDARAGLSYS